jgi:hypothetical protein
MMCHQRLLRLLRARDRRHERKDETVPAIRIVVYSPLDLRLSENCDWPSLTTEN